MGINKKFIKNIILYSIAFFLFILLLFVLTIFLIEIKYTFFNKINNNFINTITRAIKHNNYWINKINNNFSFFYKKNIYWWKKIIFNNTTIYKYKYIPGITKEVYYNFLNKINFFNIWTINNDWILKKPNVMITSKFWYRTINWKRHLHTWIDIVDKDWYLLYIINNKNNCYLLPFNSRHSYWNTLICKTQIDNKHIWYIVIWHLTNKNRKEILAISPATVDNNDIDRIDEIKKVFAFLYWKINWKIIKEYKWIKIPNKIYELKWKNFIFKYWDTWFSFWKHMHISVFVYNKTDNKFYLVNNAMLIYNFIKIMLE